MSNIVAGNVSNQAFGEKKKWGWQFGDYFNIFLVNLSKKGTYEAVNLAKNRLRWHFGKKKW